jgi:flavin-dependent dehydrogenase
MHVDIIGGGLAGLSTAISIKELDDSISVTLYERHDNIGFNHDGRRCGEAFYSEKDNKWIPKGKSLFNDIYECEMIIGKKTYVQSQSKIKTPAFMLNKPAFTDQLAKKAKEYNVTIQTKKRISKITELSSDIIVDASGCPSIIKKSLHLDNGMKGLTYQETLNNCNVFDEHRIKIYYFGKVGYYWIFPRNPKEKEVNVGVGILGNYNKSLRMLLDSFKQKMNIVGNPVYYAGGLIPLGLQRPLQTKNILFVGDAGVGTFPYLGEGIRRSLISGEIAAKCIATGHTEKYSSLIMKRFFLWDFIGKSGIHMAKTLSIISEDAMFFLLHRYFDFFYSQFNF